MLPQSQPLLRIELPQRIGAVLATNKRYKVLYGGRGSGKSWSVARYLLALAMQSGLRIMCARETQTSIKESVHKLLANQIVSMGLSEHFTIQRTTIICNLTGAEFLFSGIKDADNIKSFEAIDICWVEEAQVVSDESWEKIIPTIRKQGSEIWVVFNPDLDDDPTYVRFVINTPTNAAIAKVNYFDNPWFPSVLREEMEQLKAKNYNQYMHVWEGECITSPEGAVFNIAWFGRYISLPTAPPRTMVIHSWDTAYKADQHNDPSCCTVWHITPTLYYLAEVYHGRWEYPELRKRVFTLANEQKPDVILIEDKASGQSLIQELKTLSAHPIIAVNPERDKETRARTVTGLVESGRVSLPKQAPWLGEYEREIMLFPNGKNDDRVDSTSQFLRYMKEGGDSDAEYLSMMDRVYGK